MQSGFIVSLRNKQLVWLLVGPYSMPCLAVLHQTPQGSYGMSGSRLLMLQVPGYSHSVDETVGAPAREEGSPPSFILKIPISGASEVCRVGCPELAK